MSASKQPPPPPPPPPPSSEPSVSANYNDDDEENWRRCETCDSEFTDQQAYNLHCRGSSHTLRMMGASAIERTSSLKQPSKQTQSLTQDEELSNKLPTSFGNEKRAKPYAREGRTFRDDQHDYDDSYDNHSNWKKYNDDIRSYDRVSGKKYQQSSRLPRKSRQPPAHVSRLPVPLFPGQSYLSDEPRPPFEPEPYYGESNADVLNQTTISGSFKCPAAITQYNDSYSMPVKEGTPLRDLMKLMGKAKLKSEKDAQLAYNLTHALLKNLSSYHETMNAEKGTAIFVRELIEKLPSISPTEPAEHPMATSRKRYNNWGPAMAPTESKEDEESSNSIKLLNKLSKKLKEGLSSTNQSQKTPIDLLGEEARSILNDDKKTPFRRRGLLEGDQISKDTFSQSTALPKDQLENNLWQAASNAIMGSNDSPSLSSTPVYDIYPSHNGQQSYMSNNHRKMSSYPSINQSQDTQFQYEDEPEMPPPKKSLLVPPVDDNTYSLTAEAAAIGDLLSARSTPKLGSSYNRQYPSNDY